MSTIKTLQLYQDASRLKFWSDESFKEINKQLRRFKQPPVGRYTWNRIISNYIISVANHPKDANGLYAGMLDFLSYNIGLPLSVVKSELYRVSMTRFPISDRIPSLAVEARGDKTTLKVDPVSITIPTKMYDFYSKNNSEDMLRKLVMKYSMFDIETGFFWSMPIDMILYLDDDFTIECFGSPFNFTARKFCSAFAEDREVVYPYGFECLGDFEAVIKGLPAGRPMRFLFNPPYVTSVINSSIRELIKFVSTSPDSQIFALLPDRKLDSINKLAELPGMAVFRLEENKYKIYSHIESDSFSPRNVSFLLMVRMGENEEDSTSMLKYIVSNFF